MVTTFQSRRAARLQRRLGELRAWRNIHEIDIPRWNVAFPSGQQTKLNLGDFWPEVSLPVSFETVATIPAEWAGLPVELELWLGGEGFVRLSNGFQGGLNPMHHRFPVTSAAEGGERIEINAEVVPKGIFGSHLPEPRIERSAFVVPNIEVRALEHDLSMLAEACAVLDTHEVVPFLFEAAESALSELAPAWPTSTDESVTRYVLGYDSGLGSGIMAVPEDWWVHAVDNQRPTQPTWSLPEPPRGFEPLSDAAKAAVFAARASLAQSMERIKADYPPIGRLCMTGHAHIDLAWLWPLAETKRKIHRTFSTVIDLMDRYPDFTFNQSSAQAYAWIEEQDPALFARITERVAEGRWEPVGGMWVESDANITGGEAFVRQMLYGQRYFESRFGKRNTVVWLPDVFGYSGGMPQLMQGAGLTGFFTTKLNWNEANTFPFDLFEWEGIDGTSVVAHTFFNPGHGYNGNIVPFDTFGTWRNYRGKTRHNESLFAFGWGDGAGGPTAQMLENYARIRDYPALPRLRMGSIQEFFATLPRDGLPKAVGELYLELHRGTLTTQAKVKKLNRASEQRLYEAEAFGAIASLDGYEFDASALEAAWKTLLLNQFHDILPGSSIHEVYEDTHAQLAGVVESATALRNEALKYGANDSAGISIANPALSERPLVAFVPDVLELSLESHASITRQPVDGGILIAVPGATVPGLGAASLESVGSSGTLSAVTATTSDSNVTLENRVLRVVIGPDGAIQSLYDKEIGREALADRGNQLWAYLDKPYSWDAWDVDETYARDGEEIDDVQRLNVVEHGPIRAAVRVERQWRGSIIAQTYRLWTDSKRLDIATTIDWHERQVLLKAHMPLAVRSHQAAFETMYGTIYRPTHRNSPWDAARFEGCAHRWADISESGFGVALLNDGKYGYEALGSDLMISLLRSPLYPDPFADEGGHNFTYSLLPHVGDWYESNVVEEAFALNSPLIATKGPARSSFVRVQGLRLGIGALKRAEDGNGLVLRLYEPNGARGLTTLLFDHPMSAASTVNLLEEPFERTPGNQLERGRELKLAFRPFEVKSLRLIPA